MKQIIPFHKEILFKTMIGEITSISLEHTLTFVKEQQVQGDFIVSGTYKMTEASQIEENFSYKIPIDIDLDDRYDTKNSTLEIDDFYYEIVNEEILKVNIDLLIDGLEETVEEVIPNPEVEEVREDTSFEEEVIKSQLEEELVREEKEKEEPVMVEAKIEEPVLEVKEEVPVMVVEPEIISAMKEDTPLVIPATSSESTPSRVVTHDEVAPSLGSIFSALSNTDETFSTYSVYIVRENDSIEEILDRYKITKEELASYNNLDEFTLGCKLVIPSPCKNGE